MSDLIQRIHEAQVRAGENVVVEELRRKGLLPKLAIVIDLDQLRGLMREFIDEQKRDYPEQHETELAFEVFLQWLRKKRQETANGNQEESS